MVARSARTRHLGRESVDNQQCKQTLIFGDRNERRARRTHLETKAIRLRITQ